MSTILRLWVGVGVLVNLACASASTGGDVGAGATAAATVSAEASTWSAHGLTVGRPDGWQFIAPDQSLSPDTVVLLQGPIGDHALAPVVEIGRRPLTASDRRVRSDHILTATTVEFMQLLNSFTADSEPQEINLGDRPAAVMRAQITEMLPNGAIEERQARFYATVDVDQVWLVRCLGPRDGSADTAFDAIIGSLAFAAR